MYKEHQDEKICLIELQYFMVSACYYLTTKLPYVYIEQYERFQKMSFRNRCIISGSNGLIHLTVPLVNGRENRQAIREVRIDYSQDWQTQHWRAIESSYRRSPFFDHYCDTVRALIFERHELLFDKNKAILQWVNKVLKVPNEISFTGEYKHKYDDPGILDLRNFWLPKNFQQKVVPGAGEYIQVFHDKFGFIPNLSILDLLFCKGQL